MRVRGWGAALAVAVVMGQGLAAQTLREVTGPANPPPASFKGQQFIDSRGCVFVRAGYGGQVTWVPRIDGSKRPICGMMSAAPPMVADAPVTAAPQTPGLFARLFAPQAAVAPAAPPAPEVAISFSAPQRVLPKPPKGWSYAWKDGRLNPMRGLGTPAGQAAQDRLYTREVPQTFIADLPAPRRAKAAPVSHVTLSTMSAPRAVAGQMIQIGAFGQAGNAQRAGDRVSALGLPLAMRAQKGLTVVMAGPFAESAEAAAALVALRGAGFAEAFLR